MKRFTRHWRGEGGKRTATLSDGREIGYLLQDHWNPVFVIERNQFLVEEVDGEIKPDAKLRLIREISLCSTKADRVKLYNGFAKFQKYYRKCVVPNVIRRAAIREERRHRALQDRAAWLSRRTGG